MQLRAELIRRDRQLLVSVVLEQMVLETLLLTEET